MNRSDYWESITSSRKEDRRKFTWRSVWGTFKYGRRKAAARQIDAKNGYFSDIIESKSLIVYVVALIILNILDVISTLYIMDNGGLEVNPLMDFFIQIDTLLFASVKLGLISLGIILLYWHRHFSVLGIMRTKHLIQGLCFMYATLILYHTTLIYTILSR